MPIRINVSVAPWLSTWLAAMLISCEQLDVEPDWDDVDAVIAPALTMDVTT